MVGRDRRRDIGLPSMPGDAWTTWGGRLEFPGTAPVGIGGPFRELARIELPRPGVVHVTLVSSAALAATVDFTLRAGVGRVSLDRAVQVVTSAVFDQGGQFIYVLARHRLVVVPPFEVQAVLAPWDRL